MYQDTSREAFEQATPRRREMVMKWLREYPEGLTIDQLAVLEGVTPNMISPATNYLMRKGFIYDCGDRRLTRWKRNAIVWRRYPDAPDQA